MAIPICCAFFFPPLPRHGSLIPTHKVRVCRIEKVLKSKEVSRLVQGLVEGARLAQPSSQTAIL